MRGMVALVLGMLVCVATGGIVLGYVAREARRDSRDFWTPEGEQFISDAVRRRDDLMHRGDALRQRVGARTHRAKEPDNS